MKNCCKILVIIILSILLTPTILAEIRLPHVISDNMVLQRDIELKIWGWADISEKVTIKFRNKTYKTQADKFGKWEVKLPKQKAGGPFDMNINNLTLKNILIGDVWLCSGQSNMELPIRRVLDLYQTEIAKTDNPNIRHFKTPLAYNFLDTQEDLNGGKWTIAQGNELLDFSAVAYFFAKEIYDKYKIPIGLLNSSVGGSPAEAWIDRDHLKDFPHYQSMAEMCRQSGYIDSIRNEDNKRINNWYNTLNTNDKGYQDIYKWSDNRIDISDWKTMDLPGYWADKGLPDINGSIWFRKEINISASMISKEAILHLGCIVDADSAFVNGTYVGSVSYQYPPRTYSIPNGILKVGKNTITVRVISNAGRGGFVEDKPFKIVTGNEEINMSGEWNDIHPLNKKDVGYRLALQARKMVYGESDIISSGPIYEHAEIKENKTTLYFNLEGSKFSQEKDIKGFTIAGKDKVFKTAKVLIEGDKLIIWNEDIKEPQIIRYGWADNPYEANLMNEEGLPASPFTTELK